MREFRTFILRGNLVDLAIAVVLGTAFGLVVTALVRDLITPIIAAIGGKPDFSSLSFTINGSRFQYGDFIDAILTFLIVAATIFVFVVKPVNALTARARAKPEPDSDERPCPQCLSQVPKAAVRCAFCTSEIGAMAMPDTA
jgi:large conductance mechanosensitive channel